MWQMKVTTYFDCEAEIDRRRGLGYIEDRRNLNSLVSPKMIAMIRIIYKHDQLGTGLFSDLIRSANGMVRRTEVLQESLDLH
jgi:hypothetical protein